MPHPQSGRIARKSRALSGVLSLRRVRKTVQTIQRSSPVRKVITAGQRQEPTQPSLVTYAGRVRALQRHLISAGFGPASGVLETAPDLRKRLPAPGSFLFTCGPTAARDTFIADTYATYAYRTRLAHGVRTRRPTGTTRIFRRRQTGQLDAGCREGADSVGRQARARRS